MLNTIQRESVVAEALSWLGTPYHPHARIKGVGVDCAHILCAVYENAGIVQHVDPGYYDSCWHLHRNEELYLQWIERYCEPVEVVAPGDVVLYRFGRTYSHSAIVIDDDLVLHAYIGRGVVLSRLSEEPLAGRDSTRWGLR